MQVSGEDFATTAQQGGKVQGEAFLMKELYSHRSAHQFIKVTEDAYGGRFLFLNNRLSLTTWDQHRYYECLAIVPYLFTRYARHVLIFGGGNGYAAKTLLDAFDQEISDVTIVDLDQDMVDVARALFDFPSSPKVKVVIKDAFDFAREISARLQWDLILADFNDPTFAPARELYTVEFLSYVKGLLRRWGVFCMTSCPPFLNPKASSCMIATVAKAFEGRVVAPFKVHTPAFPPPSQQGFVLAAPWSMQLQVPQRLRFLNEANIQSIFWLDNDEAYEKTDPSTLRNLLYTQLYLTPFKWQSTEIDAVP